jgi:putative transposase
VNLIVQLKLLPTPEQAQVLLATLDRANEAANAISKSAWETQTFGQFQLHKHVYQPVKEQFGLTAQVVVRLIAKVADAYQLDKKRERRFRKRGSIAYDDRILRYYSEAVSIWTLAGRKHIAFTCDERARNLLACRQGESDLVYRGGQWYLLATVNYAEPPEGEVDDWLGVDLGIVNLATDSDGTCHSGEQVNGLRRRHRRLRQRLQAKGTGGARRLLRKRRKRERRFGTWVNHNLSKSIVATAQRTQRGIALEDLKHIRTRIRARKPQRATLHSWSFGQLRAFVEYKARLAGVPLVTVDPRNTSRTCPACGHVAKENRPDQSTFCCVSCRCQGHADYFAAVNIRRAAVSQPYAASLPRGSCNAHRL